MMCPYRITKIATALGHTLFQLSTLIVLTKINTYEQLNYYCIIIYF